MSCPAQVQLPQRLLQTHQAGHLVLQRQRAQASHLKGLPVDGRSRGRCRRPIPVLFGHIVEHPLDLGLDDVARGAATAGATAGTAQVVRDPANVQVVPIVDDGSAATAADSADATDRSGAMDRGRSAATSGAGRAQIYRATIVEPLAEDRSRIGIQGVIVSCCCCKVFAGTGTGTRTTARMMELLLLVVVVVGVNRVNNGTMEGRGRTKVLPGAVIVISYTTATGIFASPRTVTVIVKA